MLPILLAVAIVAVLLLIIVAGIPDQFVIARATTISAAPAEIFPLVNELRNWEPWNPWGKLDPNCKITYDGPPAGVGASYSWSGNSKVGAGRNTITESIPNELVRLRLEFLKPMVATNTAQFTFEPDARGTMVTWTMTGTNNKLFGLIVDCDKMVGGQFEKGLAQLKSLVEGRTFKVSDSRR